MGFSIPRQFVFGLIISMMVFMGLGSTFIEISSNYDVAIDGNVSNAITNLNDSLKNIESNFTVLGVNKLESDPLNSAGGEAGILISLWDIIKLPFKLLDMATEMFMTVARQWLLPNWFTLGIITLLTALVVFYILSAGLRDKV